MTSRIDPDFHIKSRSGCARKAALSPLRSEMPFDAQHLNEQPRALQPEVAQNYGFMNKELK
jgi:hypothetical protein